MHPKLAIPVDTLLHFPRAWESLLTTSPPPPIPNTLVHFQKIPIEIFHKIASYFPHSKSNPKYLTREVLMSLSLTCCFFHGFFRNDVYSAIKLTSSKSLTEFVFYLDKHSWPGQLTAIKFITLRWLEETHLSGDYFLANPFSNHITSQKTTFNIRFLLETCTTSLEELTLDFPEAGVHFQNAIIHSRGSFTQKHLKLKRIHISNGLSLLSAPLTFLLCSISILCAQSLEELMVDGGYPVPEDSCMDPYGLPSSELFVPGARMFRQFEKLQRLRELHVKNLAGFSEDCLVWMLSGMQMQSASILGEKRVLKLESIPGLTKDGIDRVLESVNGRLEELDIAIMRGEQVPKPLERVRPATQWSWSDEIVVETIAEDDNLSFACDANSPPYTFIDRAAKTEATHEDDSHPDLSSITKASRECFYDDDCHSSSGAYRHRYRAGRSCQSTYSTQPSSQFRLCDITHNTCKHLKRLEISTHRICRDSLFSSLRSSRHRRSNTTCYSPPSTHFPTQSLEVTDTHYDHDLSTSRDSFFPLTKLNSAVNMLPTPPASPHSLHTNLILKPLEEDARYEVLKVSPRHVSSSHPSPSSETRENCMAKLRGGSGETKKLLDFADRFRKKGTVASYVKRRRLWKWKGCGGTRDGMEDGVV